MKCSLMNGDRVPRPTKSGGSKNAAQLDRVVSELTAGKVARNEPAEGQCLRSLTTFVSRAGKRQGRAVTHWDLSLIHI